MNFLLLKRHMKRAFLFNVIYVIWPVEFNSDVQFHRLKPHEAFIIRKKIQIIGVSNRPTQVDAGFGFYRSEKITNSIFPITKILVNQKYYGR